MRKVFFVANRNIRFNIFKWNLNPLIEYLLPEETSFVSNLKDDISISWSIRISISREVSITPFDKAFIP